MQRLRSGGRDDAGAVAVLVAILFPVLFAMAAFAVDVARWYLEGERVQKAADSAALAGVIYMPQDFATAKSTAIAAATRNGYTAGGDITIEVKQGPRPSQLQVTVSNVITNNFAFLIGQPTTVIGRTAIADYTGPAPMGSPCWSFGNEPDALAQARPLNCPRTPNSTYGSFWATIHGPEVDKTQGDQFMTRPCAGGESGCTGPSNDEFDPNGYFWAIHVDDPSKVSNINLQLFDPAYVKTGFYCDNGSLPPATAYKATGMNDFDGGNPRVRYAPGTQNDPTDYCPGDGDYSSSATTPTTTTFVLRSPIDSQNPLQAPVIGQCSKQFYGWNDPGSLATILDKSKTPWATTITDRAHYQDLIAQSFHRWYTLCTIPGPLQKGDYYLQVRTNVPYGAAQASWSASGDNSNEKGEGANRFAIRAQVTGDASTVSVGSLQHMPIFANDPSLSSAKFNLIRVVPGAAGKTIKFTFFDVGDASGNGTATVTVLAPGEATGTGITASKGLTGCTGVNWTSTTETLSTCSKGGINSSTWNGKAYTIFVPIPNDYQCGYSTLSGCWFQLQVAFPTGTLLTDATTWSATITGDPVRLVK